MPKPAKARHCLYLDRDLWGRFKAAAYQEYSTASDLLAGLLEQHLAEPAALDLPHFQPRRPDDSRARVRCTVYLPAGLWNRTESAAGDAFSITALSAALIERYLELVGAAQPARPPDESAPQGGGRYLQVGKRTLDLGENPLRIQIKPKKLEDEP